jgi:hypothetical protein
MEVKAQTISWPRRHYYHCSACNWAAPQADFDVEPERCPRCGANPDGSNPWPDGVYKAPEHGWTCFHCGETFYHPIPAKRHFGIDQSDDPACKLKGAREHGMLISLRAAEAQLRLYQQEDTNLHRQIARMASEHGIALRREEEAGYARGLRDERVRSLRIVARIKATLRNGGARNACDEIGADIKDCRDG